MGCDSPKTKQLTIRRRGSFFQDPFFRDARDDYSHAVKKIVNRFNRGLVNPVGRIKDSEYHSFYKSLKSARQNFSTQSARFKDEGQFYKLMLDVGEFVGGNIAVRTAGGTVSVRGKVEIDGGEDPKENMRDDDDKSTFSGCSSTSKSLHRRFALPVDANGEKIESSLSKDAILSLIVPKRTDIHYIPVTLEGTEDKENSNHQSENLRNGSRKRPNESNNEQTHKNVENSMFNRRKRLMRDSLLDNEVNSHDEKSNNYPKEIQISNTNSKNNKITDGSDDLQRLEDKVLFNSERRSRSRKRDSKYEEVKEINIPVVLQDFNENGEESKTEDNGLNWQHSKVYEPPKENGENEYIFNNKNLEDNISSYGNNDTQVTPDNKITGNNLAGLRNMDKQENGCSKLPGSKVWEDSEETSASTSNSNEESESSSDAVSSEKSSRSTSPINELRKVSFPENKIEIVQDNEIPQVKEPIINGVCSDSEAETQDKYDDINVIQDDAYNKEENSSGVVIEDDKQDDESIIKENDTESLHVSKDWLETPKSQRSISPVTPGSRSVKVLEDETVMGDGMFNNCWYDFSNTLHDVLERLQELSSELGNSKLMDVTPSTEELPQLSEDSSLDLKNLETVPYSEVTYDAHLVQDDAYDASKGGVGCEGLASEKMTPSHLNSDIESGHLFMKNHKLSTENLDTPITTNLADSNHEIIAQINLDSKLKDLPRANCLPTPVCTHDEEDCSEDINIEDFNYESTNNSTKFNHKATSNLPNTNQDSTTNLIDSNHETLAQKYLDSNINLRPRPNCLPLASVCSPDTEDSSEKAFRNEGQNSSSFIHTPPGSLLNSMGLNSPVEALQKRFLGIEKSLGNEKEPADNQEAGSMGVLPQEEQRSVSLSSTCSQSSKDLGGSESGSESSGGLDSEINEEIESATAVLDKNEYISDASSVSDISSEKDYENDKISDLNNPHINNLNDISDKESLNNQNVSDVKINKNGDKNYGSILESAVLINKYNQTKGDVINDSDVAKESSPAKNSEPDTTTNDEMVCERPLTNSARIPFGCAKDEFSRFSRINRPRDLLLHEPYGDGACGFSSKDSMGGVFSREKNNPNKSVPEYNLSSPNKRLPPQSFSNRGVKQKFPPEEAKLPPYVRVPQEPKKRPGGFSHINSDNVRRMRDVWADKKPESKPQSPSYTTRLNSNRVSPSPTRFSKRSSFDSQEKSTPPTSKPESPRRSRADVYISPKDWPSTLRTSSPSPNRFGSQSPSYKKTASERFFGRDSPSRTYSPTAAKPLYNDVLRRASQSSQGRGSPVPSSPCRRCSRGRSESPLPSPLLERKFKIDSDRFRSHSKPTSKASSQNSSRPSSRPTSKPSSRASSIEKDIPRRSPPRGSVPKVSRAHQRIFKRLRDPTILPESQAICFKEVEEKYKMVMDVEEFVPGEIEVLQDDNRLTVKGRVELRDPEGHISVKTFLRKFDIPKNSREEEIDSALSNDGILTIFVPKKRERIIKIELVD